MVDVGVAKATTQDSHHFHTHSLIYSVFYIIFILIRQMHGKAMARTVPTALS